MSRVIFHLDMDAFYAAIEQRDNPSLRGKPVIVGSPPTQRGVVCAASYEARKFGVRSAMPSSTASRLCPSAIFVPTHMEKYKAESAMIMEILRETGAAIEPMSIDEAYLELSQLSAPARDKDDSQPSMRAGSHDPFQNTDLALDASVPLARDLKRSIYAQRQL